MKIKGIYLWLGISLLPLIFLIYMVLNYYVEVPIWDQWDLLPLLQRAYEGGLSLTNFWAQHNEHRLFFPKLIMLGLAKLSGWNHLWEIFTSVMLTVILFGLFSYYFSRSLDLNLAKILAPKNQISFWLLPVFASVLFSLNQAENWLWGWQIQIFLNILSVAWGFFLLATSSEKNITWRLPLACLAGMISSFSYAPGLLYWMSGLFFWFFLKLEKKTKRQSVIFWIATALVVFFLYFYHYQFNPGFHGESFSFSLTSFWKLFRYALSYLGSPLLPAGGRPQISLVIGLAGLLLFISLFLYFRVYLFRDRFLAVLTALAFYSIGCAFMTGWGRSVFDWSQAMSPRYITLSQFLWLCILTYLWKIRPSFQPLAALVLISFLTLILLNSWQSRVYFFEHRERLRPAQAEFFGLQNEELIGRVYRHIGSIDRQELRRNVEFLKRHRLSLFRSLN